MFSRCVARSSTHMSVSIRPILSTDRARTACYMTLVFPSTWSCQLMCGLGSRPLRHRFLRNVTRCCTEPRPLLKFIQWLRCLLRGEMASCENWGSTGSLKQRVWAVNHAVTVASRGNEWWGCLSLYQDVALLGGCCWFHYSIQRSVGYPGIQGRRTRARMALLIFSPHPPSLTA